MSKFSPKSREEAFAYQFEDDVKILHSMAATNSTESFKKHLAILQAHIDAYNSLSLQKTCKKTTNEKQAAVKCNDVRYAWGNSYLKTWFITKTKKVFLPKSSKLLFILTGEETNEPISTTDTYPKQGDVISDVGGSKLKVNSVKWI